MKAQFRMGGPEKLWGKPHCKRPDADNLFKAVTDALEGVFFLNDSQIFSAQLTKIYGDPSITLEIGELKT
jgi:Holliday junction resolvase RusA-like endonuclease